MIELRESVLPRIEQASVLKGEEGQRTNSMIEGFSFQNV